MAVRGSCVGQISWRVLVSQGRPSTPDSQRTLFACATRCRPTDNHNNGAPNSKSDDHNNSNNNQMARLVRERLGAELEELDTARRPVDPFRLFNLPHQFRIQTRAVQREMRRLQRVLHPDQHMASSVSTQARAGKLSALVNSQYRIISDPYERAKYLLAAGTKRSVGELELELESQQSSRVEPAFLERMMELGELVECSKAADAASQLTVIYAQVNEELQQLLAKLDEQFKAKNYDSVKDELAKLKFLSNLSAKLASRMENTAFN